MGNYYMGYQLDDCNVYDIGEREMTYMDAAIWLVGNKDSFRNAATNYMIPKSTLDDYINKRLRKRSYELYTVVKRIISGNKSRLARRRLNSR